MNYHSNKMRRSKIALSWSSWNVLEFRWEPKKKHTIWMRHAKSELDKKKRNYHPKTSKYWQPIQTSKRKTAPNAVNINGKQFFYVVSSTNSSHSTIPISEYSRKVQTHALEDDQEDIGNYTLDVCIFIECNAQTNIMVKQKAIPVTKNQKMPSFRHNYLLHIRYVLVHSTERWLEKAFSIRRLAI